MTRLDPPADYERKFVKPIPANDLHAIFHPRPVYDDRPDLFEQLRQRRPSLLRGILVRISDTFSSRSARIGRAFLIVLAWVATVFVVYALLVSAMVLAR